MCNMLKVSYQVYGFEFGTMRKMMRIFARPSPLFRSNDTLSLDCRQLLARAIGLYEKFLFCVLKAFFLTHLFFYPTYKYQIGSERDFVRWNNKQTMCRQYYFIFIVFNIHVSLRFVLGSGKNIKSKYQKSQFLYICQRC